MGQNYNILSIIDQGAKLRLATWSRETPLEGDHLILANGPSTTRYRVDAVEYPSGVADMSFIDATFDPRIPA